MPFARPVGRRRVGEAIRSGPDAEVGIADDKGHGRNSGGPWRGCGIIRCPHRSEAERRQQEDEGMHDPDTHNGVPSVVILTRAILEVTVGRRKPGRMRARVKGMSGNIITRQRAPASHSPSRLPAVKFRALGKPRHESHLLGKVRQRLGFFAVAECVSRTGGPRPFKVAFFGARFSFEPASCPIQPRG